MGRNKIKIKTIEDRKLRQVTFCKRKKGLLKKTMELSLLCNIEVFLAIVDPNNNLAIYNAKGSIGNFVDKYLKFPVNPKELYSNQDYQIIFEDENEMLFPKKMAPLLDDYSLNEEAKKRTSLSKDNAMSVFSGANAPKEMVRNKKRKFIKKMQTIGTRFAFKDKYEPVAPVYKGDDGQLDSLANPSSLNKLQNKLNLKVNIPEGQSIEEDDNNTVDHFPITLPNRYSQALPQQPPLQLLQQRQPMPQQDKRIISSFGSDYNQLNPFKSPSINPMSNGFKIPMKDIDTELRGTSQQVGKKILTFKEILHTLSPSTCKDQEEKYNWEDAPYSVNKYLNLKRTREDDSINSLSPRKNNLMPHYYNPHPMTFSSASLSEMKGGFSNYDDQFSNQAYANLQAKMQMNSANGIKGIGIPDMRTAPMKGKLHQWNSPK